MIDGAVAHLGERIPCTDEVASSILVSSTRRVSYNGIISDFQSDDFSSILNTRSNSPIAQLVERLTVNQFVAGSSPARGAIGQ